MSRIATSLLFVWALLLGPALCMGGMLEHECPCDDVEQCDHEDNCADDPCETLARPDTLGSDMHLDSDALAVPLCLPGESTLLRFQIATQHWDTSLPPDRPQWPFVESNRPLLI